MKCLNRINLLTIASIILFASCSSESRHYTIGVSQCSEDSWRTKLQAELEMSTYFNEGVELRFTSANDDNEVQEHQIDSLVNSGIDLLIVSPNQADPLSSAIDRAFEKGVPVILYDRKTNSSRYTAFMGADNHLIGEMLGYYVARQLGGKGHIVEIEGLEGSSPALERHKGFQEVIGKYPGLEIVASAKGDWKEESGQQAMRQILSQYDGPIDCVYGANDRMAIGARKVLSISGKDISKTLFIGVDALPTPGGGIEQVADGELSASALYPTHGDELMELALNILNGKEYGKETIMQSSLVTAENAKILLLQHEEVVRQGEYLAKMHRRVDHILTELGAERTILHISITSFLLVCILLGISIRAYHQKHALNQVLREQKKKLEEEKEIVERQRDELEEQRDKYIEATLNQPQPEEDGNVLSGNEQNYKIESEFMNKFNKVIEEHLKDSEFSVEDLGSEMCLSRVQLYRKVKAMTGKSPVEIIRETRLNRGKQLLKDTSRSIAEVAYSVGFSSPSYFTKCYKDQFGKSPTEAMNR